MGNRHIFLANIGMKSLVLLTSNKNHFQQHFYQCVKEDKDYNIMQKWLLKSLKVNSVCGNFTYDVTI